MKAAMATAVFRRMKPYHCFLILSAAALVPLAAFAANDGKGKKRPSAPPPAPSLPEALVPFDKNGNHQIDPEELAAVQQTFAEMRKLDKNGNGEIETSELAPAPSKPAAGAGDRAGRAMAGFKKVDKNGNGKIDGDEVEALQKMLAG